MGERKAEQEGGREGEADERGPAKRAARCVVERDPERQCAWLPVHHNGFTPWLREAGGCQQSSCTCTSTSSQPPHPLPPSLPDPLASPLESLN